MLLVYYVGRIIILFIGAALSPLVVLLWLLPGFRDFATNLILRPQFPDRKVVG